MSDKYKIWDQEKAYFLTLTVVGWIDVFTRKNHKMTIINSLQVLSERKGIGIIRILFNAKSSSFISQS